MLNAWGPVMARIETAGRAEVYVVVCAVLRAESATVVITDSIQVCEKVNFLIAGGTPRGKHADSWRRAMPSRDKLKGGSRLTRTNRRPFAEPQRQGA